MTKDELQTRLDNGKARDCVQCDGNDYEATSVENKIQPDNTPYQEFLVTCGCCGWQYGGRV